MIYYVEEVQKGKMCKNIMLNINLGSGFLEIIEISKVISPGYRRSLRMYYVKKSLCSTPTLDGFENTRVFKG